MSNNTGVVVEIHSACRVTTVCPTVVWHLSASEVLWRNWRHSKWGGACAHVAQPAPINPNQIHCAESDLAWQYLRSCHCEIICVYLHPEAATAPAWPWCRHIYDDIQDMMYDCSSHIGLVPKPETFRYAPKYIRETLHKLPLLSLTWFCKLHWPGVLSHWFMFAPIMCVHNKTGIRLNSATSCAIVRLLTVCTCIYVWIEDHVQPWP